MDKESPTMIMCHGTTNDRYTCPLIEEATQMLLKMGVLVVRFDFYGSGESDGEFKDKRISYMVQNLKDVISYVLKHNHVDKRRIGLWGRSVGGTIVTACSNPEEILTNIVISAPVFLNRTFYPIYEQFGKQEYTPLSRSAKSLDKATGKVKGEMVLPRQWFEELAEIDAKISENLRDMRSVLVIQADSDKKVEQENARAIFEKVGNPKELYVVHGADHSYEGFEKEVLTLVEKWVKSSGLVT